VRRQACIRKPHEAVELWTIHFKVKLAAQQLHAFVQNRSLPLSKWIRRWLGQRPVLF